jgi:hypothetical protein
MQPNDTPESGTPVGGAIRPCETLEKNMDEAGETTSSVSSNNPEEGTTTTPGNSTDETPEVTPKTDFNVPSITVPSELTPELREWLCANIETYETILLHAMIHDRKLRDAVLGLPIEQKDIEHMDNALVFLAFKKAAMLEQILGVEIPVPASSTFLQPHVEAAAIDLEVGDHEKDMAMRQIVGLQRHDYDVLHPYILPCLAAWFGAKRGKRVARNFMMHKVPDVRGLTENLMADLDAASGLSIDLENRKFDFEQQPVPPESIIELAGHTIGTPGNLVTIQGPVKSAKSTVLEGIMAAAMKYPCFTCDTLGISVAQPDGLALLHFDTEQSKHDHDRLLRRSYKRAKRLEIAGWLYSYHLTGMDPAACWNMLKLAIKSAVKDHGGVMMILIDGIADFCKDPNDAGECFELVRKLHKLAVDHECVIVTVIHENPGNGGGKTRGHLGSQLDRKVETSLRLQKDTKTGVVEMWVERGRSCFIPKSAGIRFHWGNESQMHVTLHASEGDAVGPKMDKLTRISQEVAKVFIDEERLTYSRLVEKIMALSNLAESTAKTRIPEYITFNLIKKNDDGTYQLSVPNPSNESYA